MDDGRVTELILRGAGAQGADVTVKRFLYTLESDGLTDEYGTDVVWSAQRILDDNMHFRGDEQFRSLYMPFDSLMFFGDNGGGDQFAFVRVPERNEVFVWDHETDSRNLVSPDLESYLRSVLGSDGEDWYR
ncbi:SMI1/KNR4 family protein [Streptomyces griseoincarnatus]